MKRIKHNDLTHYFLRDHKDLPRAYLDSCEKFFKELSAKEKMRKIKEDNDFLDKQSNAEYYDTK